MQSLLGKEWTASVMPLAPCSIYTILTAAKQKGAVALLLLLCLSMATHGLSEREQVHGQIFPLHSHFLGSCSSKPSPVSWLAFPQRRIISPSSSGH